MQESKEKSRLDPLTEVSETPFGERIRQARLRRGWTLQQLADCSSVSRAMLSKVERGEKNPTIRVAKLICRALEIPLSSLVGRVETGSDHQLTRANAQSVFRDENTGFIREVLIPDDGNGTELVRHELPAGVSTDWLPAQTTGTSKQIVVEQGQLTIAIGDVSHRLAPGDAISFIADVPHQFTNEDTVSCRYILVIRKP